MRVPILILVAPNIHYTFCGKKVESAVIFMTKGKVVMNQNALKNSDFLDYFVRLFEDLKGK